MVSVHFCREFGTRIIRDPASESGRRAIELAIFTPSSIKASWLLLVDLEALVLQMFCAYL